MKNILKTLGIGLLLGLAFTAYATVFNSNQIATSTPMAPSGYVILSQGNNTPAFWVSSTSLPYQPILTNPVTGTGVLDFVSRWTSTSAIGQGKFMDNGTVTGINATSSSINFNLQGTAGAFDPFNVATSTGSTTFIVKQSGNVGVGLSAPGDTLDVSGTFNVSAPAGAMFTATGGTITTSGSYTIHTFTSNGTFTPSTSGNIDFLVIGGGGGGAGGGGGGGGAGGYQYSTNVAVTAQGYTVTVGAGGDNGTGAQFGHAGNGGNSVFDSITANGGGGGGNNESDGQAGASGGGGGSAGGGNHPGGAGTAGQGNNGGHDDAVSPYGTGGGGGASAVGADASGGVAGAGGNGTANSITGVSVTYAGGGGGGTYFSGTGGAGGSGGGGAGSGSGAGGNGTNGLGGGGGGGNGPIGTDDGGVGGSGVVIIRYLTNQQISAVPNIIRASSVGNVGIGTSSAVSRVDIYGLAGTADIFGVSSSSFSRLFTITYAGKVGIGTNTPSTALSVIGTTTTSGLNIPGLTSTFLSADASGNVIATTSPLLSLSGGINGYVTRWTSASAISTGKLLDNGTVVAINASSSSYTFNVQGNSGTNPFNVASSTGTGLFSIDNLGNTTIGSTSPKYYNALDITNAATGSFPTVTEHLGNTNDGAYIQTITAGDISLNGGVYFDASSTTWIPTHSFASIMQASGGNLLFQANSGLTPGTAYTPVTRMKVFSSGEVTIATTTPPTNTMFYLNGHQQFASTTPTVSSCGTSPTMIADSSDNSGGVNVGSVTATSCKVTFSLPFSHPAFCTVSDDNTGIAADISAVSSSSVTFGFSVSLASGHVYYHCF